MYRPNIFKTWHACFIMSNAERALISRLFEGIRNPAEFCIFEDTPYLILPPSSLISFSTQHPGFLDRVDMNTYIALFEPGTHGKPLPLVEFFCVYAPFRKGREYSPLDPNLSRRLGVPLKPKPKFFCFFCDISKRFRGDYVADLPRITYEFSYGSGEGSFDDPSPLISEKPTEGTVEPIEPGLIRTFEPSFRLTASQAADRAAQALEEKCRRNGSIK